MRFGLFDAGIYPDFFAVKDAFESTYSCLGITCAQVGELDASLAEVIKDAEELQSRKKKLLKELTELCVE